MTGILLAMAAALATALSHVLAKDSLHRQDFPAFLIVRTTAASAVLAVLLLFRGGMAELLAIPEDIVWLLIGLGFICPLSTNIAYFSALKRLQVNVAIPVFHCFPAIAFVLGLLFLSLPFSLVNLAGVLCVIGGTAGFCLRQAESDELMHARLSGIALAIFAALLFASTIICWKVLRERASPLAITFLGTSTSAVTLLAAYSWRLRLLRWDGLATNMKTAISGILIFGFANLLSIHAMEDLSPAVVYSVVSSSVLWVGVFALVMLREKWTPLQIVSALLVFAGVVVLGLSR